jgi:uncharacterized SAM-binding protein YcdF (DUF218 family)
VSINYLIWSFIKPSHLLIWLAVLGILFRHRWFGRWCVGALALLVLVFGLLPTAHWLVKPLEQRFPQQNSPDRVDGIIVLAGSEHLDLSKLYDQPQLNSMGDRLTGTLMLAASYPQAKLIYSGKFRSPIARQLLLGAGIATERIRFEADSEDTCESAMRVRDMLPADQTEIWLLVTSAFHLPRAVACFEAVNLKVLPYPVDYRTGSVPLSFSLVRNLENLDYAAHEWLGLAYYRMTGRTRSLFPGPASVK